MAPFWDNARKADRATSILMWDLAGTLLPHDPFTGRAGPLPGWTDFLPELDREFRQVVTTGDTAREARSLLQETEMLPQFEEIFGELGSLDGKPYGAILQKLGGAAAHSLAVGDTLPSDLPKDVDDLVTVLINQNGQRHNAGRVAFLVHILRKQDPACLPAAFDRLLAGAAPQTMPARSGPSWTPETAGRRNDGFDYTICTFVHPRLPGKRRVIIL